MNETRLIWFQAKAAQIKIDRLVETAHVYLHKKERILFFVEDAKALQYVDELLWKVPATSFLPHISSDAPTDELIVITTTKQNLNQAHAAFNLCSTPLLLPFRTVYDFEDLTSPHKQQLSSLRYDAYKNAHFSIEARS
jgi:DNA polymerase-3 subunit chi